MKSAPRPKRKKTPVKRTTRPAAKPARRPRTTRPAQPKAQAAPSPAFRLAERICEIILSKKGVDPVIVDVREKSGFTDYFVVASAGNLPHVRAIFDEVQTVLKHEGTPCYRRTESFESGWVVLDFVDVVMHVLLDEMRKYYSIEDLWSQSRQE